MAGPKAITLSELVTAIANCMNLPAPSLHLPKLLVWPGVYTLEIAFGAIGKRAPFTRRSMKFFTGNTAFRTEKVARMLDFTATTDLKTGLEETHQWMLRTGKI